MSTSASRNLVRQILGTSKGPLTSRQIFERAAAKYPSAQVPSSTSNVQATGSKNTKAKETPKQCQYIPSLRQLKLTALPGLANRQLIQKIHIKRQTTQAEFEESMRVLKKKAAKKGRTIDVERLKLEQATVDGWVWQMHPTAKELPLPESPIAPEPPFPSILQPTRPPKHNPARPDLLVHLNSRRREARPAKVSADEKWIKEVSEQITFGEREMKKEIRKQASETQKHA